MCSCIVDADCGEDQLIGLTVRSAVVMPSRGNREFSVGKLSNHDTVIDFRCLS